MGAILFTQVFISFVQKQFEYIDAGQIKWVFVYIKYTAALTLKLLRITDPKNV